MSRSAAERICPNGAPAAREIEEVLAPGGIWREAAGFPDRHQSRMDQVIPDKVKPGRRSGSAPGRARSSSCLPPSPRSRKLPVTLSVQNKVVRPYARVEVMHIENLDGFCRRGSAMSRVRSDFVEVAYADLL